MTEQKSMRKLVKETLPEDSEPESYRVQIRLSAEDYRRLEAEARLTYTAMSFLGSLFIHDGLDDREKKRRAGPPK